MPLELYPYQQTGATFLARRGRALLADEMGLGKSAQAIAACDIVGAGLSVGVVCPASVKANWKREFALFGREAHNVDIESYDKVARGAFDKAAFDVLILDEAHYLKSPKAKRTKAIYGPKCDGVDGLVGRSNRVFLLTGTPTPNDPSELWTHLRAVMPGAIAGKTRPRPYFSFINRYCTIINKGFGPQITGGRRLDELRALTAPYILRRKKADVLTDLPPIRFAELALEGRIERTPDLEDAELAIADALEEYGIDGLARVAPHVATLRRVTGMAKVAPAVAWIRDAFEGGLDKLVVFAHHRDVLDGILSGIGGCGMADPAMVTGSTPAKNRQLHVDRFQNDPKCKIFLGQIQASGVGITLHAASNVLFVESSWTPSDNEQAAARIHRIGQNNACLVRFAMLAGSIDETIQRAILRKTADISKLFG